MKNKNLLESIFILYKSRNILGYVWNLIEAHHYSDEVASLNYYLVVEAVTFLDEYKKGFVPNRVEPEFQQRVREVRQVCKPIIKKIEQRWKQLYDFRSAIGAHPWRIKKGEFVIPETYFDSAPKSWMELRLLLDLITYLFVLISGEFPSEAPQALEILELREKERNRTTIENNEEDFLRTNEEIQQMALEVNEECQNLNKLYRLPVITYAFSDEPPA